jgi:hypothetical protein
VCASIFKTEPLGEGAKHTIKPHVPNFFTPGCSVELDDKNGSPRNKKALEGRKTKPNVWDGMQNMKPNNYVV